MYDREAGSVTLYGAGADAIQREAQILLDDAAIYEQMARAHNPYGDGEASGRIVARLLKERSDG